MKGNIYKARIFSSIFIFKDQLIIKTSCRYDDGVSVILLNYDLKQRACPYLAYHYKLE
jgi:hypothetical protein